MPDELVDFMNNFQLGSSIKFLVILGGFVFAQYKLYKGFIAKMKDQGSKETLDELEDKKQKEELLKCKKAVLALYEETKKLKQQIKMVSNKVETAKTTYADLEDTAEDLHNDSLNQIDAMEKKLNNFNVAMNQINASIADIMEKIDVLTDSDANSQRAYIISEYHRCVEVEKQIDLMTLQSVESVYKKYLAEDKSGGDEFITGLVREMRNLPTTKK